MINYVRKIKKKNDNTIIYKKFIFFFKTLY